MVVVVVVVLDKIVVDVLEVLVELVEDVELVEVELLVEVVEFSIGSIWEQPNWNMKDIITNKKISNVFFIESLLTCI